MTSTVFFASGDPVLFLLIGGTILLAGAVVALGVTGVVLLLGRSDEKRRIGKRLLLAMGIILVIGACLWVSVVGWD